MFSTVKTPLNAIDILYGLLLNSCFIFARSGFQLAISQPLFEIRIV
jgi:hypothetical protein